MKFSLWKDKETRLTQDVIIKEIDLIEEISPEFILPLNFLFSNNIFDKSLVDFSLFSSLFLYIDLVDDLLGISLCSGSLKINFPSLKIENNLNNDENGYDKEELNLIFDNKNRKMNILMKLNNNFFNLKENIIKKSADPNKDLKKIKQYPILSLMFSSFSTMYNIKKKDVNQLNDQLVSSSSLLLYHPHLILPFVQIIPLYNNQQEFNMIDFPSVSSSLTSSSLPTSSSISIKVDDLQINQDILELYENQPLLIIVTPKRTINNKVYKLKSYSLGSVYNGQGIYLNNIQYFFDENKNIENFNIEEDLEEIHYDPNSEIDEITELELKLIINSVKLKNNIQFISESYMINYFVNNNIIKNYYNQKLLLNFKLINLQKSKKYNMQTQKNEIIQFLEILVELIEKNQDFQAEKSQRVSGKNEELDYVNVDLLYNELLNIEYFDIEEHLVCYGKVLKNSYELEQNIDNSSFPQSNSLIIGSFISQIYSVSLFTNLNNSLMENSSSIFNDLNLQIGQININYKYNKEIQLNVEESNEMDFSENYLNLFIGKPSSILKSPLHGLKKDVISLEIDQNSTFYEGVELLIEISIWVYKILTISPSQRIFYFNENNKKSSLSYNDKENLVSFLNNSMVLLSILLKKLLYYNKTNLNNFISLIITYFKKEEYLLFLVYTLNHYFLEWLASSSTQELIKKSEDFAALLQQDQEDEEEVEKLKTLKNDASMIMFDDNSQRKEEVGSNSKFLNEFTESNLLFVLDSYDIVTFILSFFNTLNNLEEKNEIFFPDVQDSISLMSQSYLYSLSDELYNIFLLLMIQPFYETSSLFLVGYKNEKNIRKNQKYEEKNPNLEKEEREKDEINLNKLLNFFSYFSDHQIKIILNFFLRSDSLIKRLIHLSPSTINLHQLLLNANINLNKFNLFNIFFTIKFNFFSLILLKSIKDRENNLQIILPFQKKQENYIVVNNTQYYLNEKVLLSLNLLMILMDSLLLSIKDIFSFSFSLYEDKNSIRVDFYYFDQLLLLIRKLLSILSYLFSFTLQEKEIKSMKNIPLVLNFINMKFKNFLFSFILKLSNFFMKPILKSLNFSDYEWYNQIFSQDNDDNTPTKVQDENSHLSKFQESLKKLSFKNEKDLIDNLNYLNKIINYQENNIDENRGEKIKRKPEEEINFNLFFSSSLPYLPLNSPPKRAKNHSDYIEKLKTHQQYHNEKYKEIYSENPNIFINNDQESEYLGTSLLILLSKNKNYLSLLYSLCVLHNSIESHSSFNIVEKVTTFSKKDEKNEYDNNDDEQYLISSYSSLSFSFNSFPLQKRVNLIGVSSSFLLLNNFSTLLLLALFKNFNLNTINDLSLPSPLSSTSNFFSTYSGSIPSSRSSHFLLPSINLIEYSLHSFLYGETNDKNTNKIIIKKLLNIINFYFNVQSNFFSAIYNNYSDLFKFLAIVEKKNELKSQNIDRSENILLSEEIKEKNILNYLNSNIKIIEKSLYIPMLNLINFSYSVTTFSYILSFNSASLLSSSLSSSSNFSSSSSSIFNFYDDLSNDYIFLFLFKQLLHDKNNFFSFQLNNKNDNKINFFFSNNNVKKNFKRSINFEEKNLQEYLNNIKLFIYKNLTEIYKLLFLFFFQNNFLSNEVMLNNFILKNNNKKLIFLQVRDELIFSSLTSLKIESNSKKSNIKNRQEYLQTIEEEDKRFLHNFNDKVLKKKMFNKNLLSFIRLDNILSNFSLATTILTSKQSENTLRIAFFYYIISSIQNSLEYIQGNNFLQLIQQEIDNKCFNERKPPENQAEFDIPSQEGDDNSIKLLRISKKDGKNSIKDEKNYRKEEIIKKITPYFSKFYSATFTSKLIKLQYNLIQSMYKKNYISIYPPNSSSFSSLLSFSNLFLSLTSFTSSFSSSLLYDSLCIQQEVLLTHPFLISSNVKNSIFPLLLHENNFSVLNNNLKFNFFSFFFSFLIMNKRNINDQLDNKFFSLLISSLTKKNTQNNLGFLYQFESKEKFQVENSFDLNLFLNDLLQFSMISSSSYSLSSSSVLDETKKEFNVNLLNVLYSIHHIFSYSGSPSLSSSLSSPMFPYSSNSTFSPTFSSSSNTTSVSTRFLYDPSSSELNPSTFKGLLLSSSIINIFMTQFSSFFHYEENDDYDQDETNSRLTKNIEDIKVQKILNKPQKKVFLKKFLAILSLIIKDNIKEWINFNDFSLLNNLNLNSSSSTSHPSSSFLISFSSIFNNFLLHFFNYFHYFGKSSLNFLTLLQFFLQFYYNRITFPKFFNLSKKELGNQIRDLNKFTHFFHNSLDTSENIEEELVEELEDDDEDFNENFTNEINLLRQCLTQFLNTGYWEIGLRITIFYQEIIERNDDIRRKIHLSRSSSFIPPPPPPPPLTSHYFSLKNHPFSSSINSSPPFPSSTLSLSPTSSNSSMSAKNIWYNSSISTLRKELARIENEFIEKLKQEDVIFNKKDKEFLIRNLQIENDHKNEENSDSPTLFSSSRIRLPPKYFAIRQLSFDPFSIKSGDVKDNLFATDDFSTLNIVHSFNWTNLSQEFKKKDEKFGDSEEKSPKQEDSKEGEHEDIQQVLYERWLIIRLDLTSSVNNLANYQDFLVYNKEKNLGNKKNNEDNGQNIDGKTENEDIFFKFLSFDSLAEILESTFSDSVLLPPEYPIEKLLDLSYYSLPQITQDFEDISKLNFDTKENTIRKNFYFEALSNNLTTLNLHYFQLYPAYPMEIVNKLNEIKEDPTFLFKDFEVNYKNKINFDDEYFNFFTFYNDFYIYLPRLSVDSSSFLASSTSKNFQDGFVKYSLKMPKNSIKIENILNESDNNFINKSLVNSSSSLSFIFHYESQNITGLDTSIQVGFLNILFFIFLINININIFLGNELYLFITYEIFENFQ